MKDLTSRAELWQELNCKCQGEKEQINDESSDRRITAGTLSCNKVARDSETELSGGTKFFLQEDNNVGLSVSCCTTLVQTEKFQQLLH